MSAVMRQDRAPGAEPTPNRATGAPGASGRGQWDWPDPREVAPPDVVARPAPSAAPVPLAARWPVAAPVRAWPPLPEAEDGRRPVAAPKAAAPAPGLARTPVAAPVRAFLHDDSGAAAAFADDHDLPPAPPSVAVFDRVAHRAESEPRPRASDPSPSRLAYRLHRMWLTPAIRHFVRVGLPALLLAAVIAGWLSDAGRRADLVAAADSIRAMVEQRPEFQVTAITVQSRSPEVARGVELLLGVSFPVSSLQLDMADLRRRAEALDAVERASVMVRGGVLEVRIDERLPAMIWRHSGGLDLVDARGNRVARLATRTARPDLPLIAGDGAPAAIAEARLLWAAATPLHDRLRGLVRVGERRWDLVLDRGQRIQLPADGALGALERALALHAGQDLLARDIAVVDLRNPARPTLRLTEGAMAELNRIRQATSGARQ